MTKKRKKDWVTRPLERIAYVIYFIGQLIFNVIVSSYTLVYLLNAGINEVTAGAILLAPKIIDAIDDTVFGILVDKVRFKKGRFLPWVKLASILMPLATIFFFSMPGNVSNTVKCIWVIIGYILWDICYTMCDAPVYALVTSMTNDMDERNSILSYTRISGGIGGMLASIMIPMMYGTNGMNLGWSKTAIIVSLFGAAMMLPAGFLVKERYHGEKEEEVGFRELFASLFENRNLVIIILVRFIFMLTMSAEVLSSVFAQYVLGNETLGSLLTMAISMPALVLSAIMPALMRRFDKVHLYAFFMGTFVVASIIQYFMGYGNLALVIGLSVLRGIGYGGFSILSFMFVPDCIEYSQFSGGRRNEGVSFALQTFVNKLNAAIISSISAFFLAVMGFSAANVTPEGQRGVWMTYTLLSALGGIAAIPLLLKCYTLTDKKVAIMMKANNGEISKQEALKQIGE
ncbi:MAG: MFS transporter [Erysipelotrichaceae bacterium]|nr:MFS transporter [Erysipelotrichaceae bacterium]